MSKFNFPDSKAAKAVVKARALKELWKRRDHIDTLLDSTQLEMYKAFKEYDGISTKFVWLCSRRLGKSVALSAIADEFCRDNPDARVLFLSKTTDNLTEIVDQAFGFVLANCPDELKPSYKVKANKMVYDNGAEIRFKGMDRDQDSIRGVKAHLIILDEFCFMENLEYLLKSILDPMMIAEGGRMLAASTPPESPGHASIKIIQDAEVDDAIIKKTIYDCPRYTEKQLELFAREAGGVDSDTFKREYLCQIITQRDRAILPACTEEHMSGKIVKEVEKPSHYVPDHYIAIDPGGRDLTAILFAYWDYDRAVLVIEDEVLLSDPGTIEIDKAIRDVLKGPWKHVKPRKIVMDNNNTILIRDIKRLHGLRVVPTKKDKKEAQVNQTNLMFLNEQVEIDPKCKQLINQCKYGIWNKTHTSYERTAALSHCDAVDALVYLIRNLDRNHVPYPEVTPGEGQDYLGFFDRPKSGQGLKGLASIFKR